MGLACVKPIVKTKTLPEEHFTGVVEPEFISEIDRTEEWTGTEDWTDVSFDDAVDKFSSLEALVSEWQAAHPEGGLTDEELASIHDSKGNLVPWEVIQAATAYHKDEDSSRSTTKITLPPKVHIHTDLGHPTTTTKHTPRELSPKTTSAVATIIKDIKLAVEESRILSAFMSLQRLTALTGLTREEITEKYYPDIDAVNIATESEAVITCLQAINNNDEDNDDDNDWLVSQHAAAKPDGNNITTNSTSSKGLKILYSHDQHSTAHKLKLSATFDHPIAHVLALAHEWDYLPLWNKFNVEAIKIAEPTLYESYLYGAQWSPPPFKNMQALVKARGFDLSEEQRCLFIVINDTEVEDIPAEHVIGQVPSDKTLMKRKRVNILPPSCIKLIPVPHSSSNNGMDEDVHTTEAVMLVHVDPHIKFVPSMLVNFVLGILAPYIYRQMVQTLDSQFSHPDKPFPTRIREQPELYEELERRIKLHSDDWHLEF